MQTILKSIRPQHTQNILSGTKKIEIDKKMPKCVLPAEVYIYCTNSGGVMDNRLREVIYIQGRKVDEPRQFYLASRKGDKDLNGKVVAHFVLKYATPIWISSSLRFENSFARELGDACISRNEALTYFGLQDENLYKVGDCIIGYAWHISDLVVFDEPMELKAFKAPCTHAKVYDLDRVCCFETNDCQIFGGGKCEKGYKPLTRAPQSWQYVKAPGTEEVY